VGVGLCYDQLSLVDNISSQLVLTHLGTVGGGAFGWVGMRTVVCGDVPSVYVRMVTCGCGGLGMQ